MKITDKYISQKLAQRICEAAKEKGIKLPESEYCWVRVSYSYEREKENKNGFVFDKNGDLWRWELHREDDSVDELDGEWIPAYDLKEIFDFMNLDIPLDLITELAIMGICKNDGKISKTTKATIKSLILERLDDWVKK